MTSNFNLQPHIDNATVLMVALFSISLVGINQFLGTISISVSIAYGIYRLYHEHKKNNENNGK